MEAVRWRLSLVATPYYLLWLRCQDTEYDSTARTSRAVVVYESIR